MADETRYSRTKTSIWTDRDFIGLSAGAQRLYWLILSQAELTLCGVLQPAFRRWANFASDTGALELENSAKELADAKFILIDDATDELLVRTFVKHDLALQSDNSLVGMAKAYESIHSKVLRKVVMEGLQKELRYNLHNRIARTIPDGQHKVLRERLPIGFLRDWETPL